MQRFQRSVFTLTAGYDSLCLHEKSIPVKLGCFYKTNPVSETIFGNIKKPPDIIHGVEFLLFYFTRSNEQVLLS